MPYSDEKFGNIFPTRTGTPLGGAGERQMLDAIDGANSFRTRVQNNPDGSETLLRTKDGMPQFTTSNVGGSEEAEDRAERTFVFTERDIQSTATVANRSGTSFAVVLKQMAVKLRAAYSVLLTKSATLSEGYKTATTAVNKWRDVSRLDEREPKLIGGKITPTPLAEIGEVGLPGIPLVFDREHTHYYASRIVAGINDEYITVGLHREYKVGVATYKKDGTILVFTPVVGAATYSIHGACGVQLKQGIVAPGILYGDYLFHWQGNDPATDGSATTSCYTRIRVTPFALPTVHEQSATVTKFATVEFGSVNYNQQAPSTSDSVIGEFYSYQLQVWYGPDLSFVSPYGWVPYAATRTWAGPKNVYTAVQSSGWNKNISFSDTYCVGAGNAELTVNRSVSGSENWTAKAGAGGLDATRYYVATSGEENHWHRTTEAIAQTRHVVLDKDLYKATYTQESDGLLGQLKSPTVTWDWQDISRPFVYFGSIWVYFLNNTDYGAYNAASLARCQEFMAANNASTIERAAVSVGPPDYGTDAPRTTTYPADNYQTRRTDNGSLTIDTRDYVYYDPEEGVSLALIGEVRHTRSRHKTPWDYNIERQPLDGEWSGLTSIDVYYELDIRGTIRTFPVYSNGAAWWPAVDFEPVLEKDAPDVWEKRFSGAHVPGTPNLYFAPMYMHQGRCPWVAYTTLLEEANGATPEFYIDLKIKPNTGKNTLSEGESYDATIVFQAYNLNAAFANYMGKNAPKDVFEDVMFVSPVRISLALGISESNGWQAKLGAPFSANSHVTITRI